MIFNSSTSYANPQAAYARGTGAAKPTTVTTKQPNPTRIASRAKEREITELQDTIVNNPSMSNYRKDELETKLTTLIAEKNVLDWKAAHKTSPTVEDYETQKRYYDNLWQQNQDAIVKGLNNGTLDIGTDQ